jgi:hypothetical protein
MVGNNIALRFEDSYSFIRKKKKKKKTKLVECCQFDECGSAKVGLQFLALCDYCSMDIERRGLAFLAPSLFLGNVDDGKPIQCQSLVFKCMDLCEIFNCLRCVH